MYSKFLEKLFTREYKHLRPEVQSTLRVKSGDIFISPYLP